jgi:hypothetical protein
MYQVPSSCTFYGNERSYDDARGLSVANRMSYNRIIVELDSMKIVEAWSKYGGQILLQSLPTVVK